MSQPQVWGTFGRHAARQALGVEHALKALKAWEDAELLHQACGNCQEVAEAMAKARKLRALALEQP